MKHQPPDRVVLELRHDTGETHLTTWGAFRRIHQDDIDAIKAAYLVVLGLSPRETIGGTTTITRRKD